MICEANIYNSLHDGYNFIIPNDEAEFGTDYSSLRQVIDAASWDEVSLHRYKVSEISASLIIENLDFITDTCVIVFDGIEDADEDLIAVIEGLMKFELSFTGVRADCLITEDILTNIVLVAGSDSAAYNRLRNVENVRNYVNF